MELKRIILENFESHEYTDISFSSGLNCIVGPTNSGKTAIYNALSFVFFNDWENDFIRHGCSSCSVTVYTDTLCIKRIKGDKINTLSISDNTGERVYTNFGVDYPDEVKRLFIGMVDDLSVCFSPQDAGPFLIYENSNKKGEAINKLAGISILNQAVEDVNAEIKQEKEVLRELFVTKQKLLKEYRKFKYLPKIERLYEKYEKKLSLYNGLLQRKNTLEVISSQLSQFCNVNDLRNIIDQLSEIDFDYWTQALSQLYDVLIIFNNIKLLNEDIRNCQFEIESINNDLNVMVQELIDLIEQEKVCPLCGNYFSSISIDFLFKELL